MGDQFTQFTPDELTALVDGLARLVAAILAAAGEHGHPIASDPQTASLAADQLEHAGRLMVAIDTHRGRPCPSLDAVRDTAMCVRSMCA